MLTERGLRASGYLVVVGRHSFGGWYSVLCDAAGRARVMIATARRVVATATVQRFGHVVADLVRLLLGGLARIGHF